MQKGQLQNWDSVLQALGTNADTPEVISVVGGGGKTTLLRRLQRECREAGIPHAVSTTTHMQYERNGAFLEKPSMGSFRRILAREGTVWMGHPVSEVKMIGFPPEFMDRVRWEGNWLLLEADGAKGLPVKAPASHEPVILPCTTRVIQVYGLDGVGKPIGEVCFRVPYVTKLLGKSPADLLMPGDIARLAMDPEAGRKQVTKGMQYQILLNKADDRKRCETAMEIIRALSRYGMEDVLVTAGLLA
jgi:probable selenium-dependent hydroxylase accessory protein YqeC